MNDNNSEDNHLSIKEIFNEALLRDLLLFGLLYVLIITQIWENIFLFLFPLISFAFSIFFRIININKWRTEFTNGSIIYNPFGSERNYANRLAFSSFIQLILLYWLGSESLHNPHLADDYFIYFNILFIFTYSFGFYWIFIDLWKFSKVEIIFKNLKMKNSQIKDTNISLNLNNVISHFKINKFKLISIGSTLNFLLLNILNLIFLAMYYNNLFIGLEYKLPGTGSEGSEPISLSFLTFAILIISPTLTALFLVSIYRDIKSINTDKLTEILKTLPYNIQIQIMENLKALNSKIKEKMKIE
ncbi:MAG: hypothetical protein ACFE9T_00745 [Promethearchaeota archaeon]